MTERAIIVLGPTRNRLEVDQFDEAVEPEQRIAVERHFPVPLQDDIIVWAPNPTLLPSHLTNGELTSELVEIAVLDEEGATSFVVRKDDALSGEVVGPILLLLE